MAKQRKTTAREWAGRVKRWGRSGLSARAFGEREGFRGEQLTWWKWHLRQRGRATPVAPRRQRRRKMRSPKPVQFVEVKLPAAVPAPPDVGIEIVLGNGRTVRVPPGCDGTWLASVLAAADGGRPC